MSTVRINMASRTAEIPTKLSVTSRNADDASDGNSFAARLGSLADPITSAATPAINDDRGTDVDVASREHRRSAKAPETANTKDAATTSLISVGQTLPADNVAPLVGVTNGDDTLGAPRVDAGEPPVGAEAPTGDPTLALLADHQAAKPTPTPTDQKPRPDPTDGGETPAGQSAYLALMLADTTGPLSSGVTAPSVDRTSSPQPAGTPGPMPPAGIMTAADPTLSLLSAAVSPAALALATTPPRATGAIASPDSGDVGSLVNPDDVPRATAPGATALHAETISAASKVDAGSIAAGMSAVSPAHGHYTSSPIVTPETILRQDVSLNRTDIAVDAGSGDAASGTSAADATASAVPNVVAIAAHSPASARDETHPPPATAGQAAIPLASPASSADIYAPAASTSRISGSLQTPSTPPAPGSLPPQGVRSLQSQDNRPVDAAGRVVSTDLVLDVALGAGGGSPAGRLLPGDTSGLRVAETAATTGAAVVDGRVLASFNGDRFPGITARDGATSLTGTNIQNSDLASALQGAGGTSGNGASRIELVPSPLATSVGSGSVDLTSAGGAGQLAEQIIRLAAGNQRDVTLHLHPPDLGDLTVRVEVTGREVAAWFGSPLIQVQQAVSQGMGQLDANLGSAGYTLSGAWVGADASGDSRQDQYVAQPPVPTADGATTIASATTSEIASSVLPMVSGVSVYA